MQSALAILGGSPVRKTPFTRWPAFDDAERRALSRVLESGNWGGFPSPNVEASALARRFAEAHGAKHGICVANGTVTLQLALRAGGVKRGDEVIVPPLTFMATAGAPVVVGATPVFADVKPSDYTLDPADVERKITPRTRAIICVHLGSSIADLDALGALAEKHGLALIEDCAHAHGAKWRGRGVGSWGAFGSFSFQSSKLMTAGEGGIVLTSDDRAAKQVQSLNNCGRLEPGYEDAEPWLGHNYRMTEFQAALLCAQLERLPEQTARRNENIDRFARGLVSIPGCSTLAEDPRMTTRSGYQYIFRFDGAKFASKTKGKILHALRGEGLAVYEGYFPLNRAHGTGEFDFGEELFPVGTFAAQWYDLPERVPRTDVRCPNAEQAARESIWIPHQVFLGPPSDVDSVLEALAKVQKHAEEIRA